MLIVMMWWVVVSVMCMCLGWIAINVIGRVIIILMTVINNHLHYQSYLMSSPYTRKIIYLQFIDQPFFILIEFESYLLLLLFMVCCFIY